MGGNIIGIFPGVGGEGVEGAVEMLADRAERLRVRYREPPEEVIEPGRFPNLQHFGISVAASWCPLSMWAAV